MATNPRVPLFMDSDTQILGNSPGLDGRGRLHMKLANGADEPVSIETWLLAKPGRKIERTLVNPTTEDFSYLESMVEMMRIRIVYTSAAREDIVSAERTV